ncbi:MAG: TrkH family potassium uptake protein [Gammaproteobacteria bacterium]|nr:TrkH family potassium uptake protein [Gammaproteobacteria bacterium]MBU1725465.1 TrkH family potassium uptake protein [Gammaproteobacteria bacterium]MBU2005798.1 TrkH family potassium uptake protein [Gammaproteobacteria bacterium]
MQFKVIQRILGLLLMVFSLTMLPPILVGWIMGDPQLAPFWDGFLLILLAGLAMWWPVRSEGRDLRLRDGFLIAVLFWTILSAAGTTPFLLAEELNLSAADAFFETVSGFTTTGATVLVGIDSLPRSINFYRMELHWLGGMGIIVLAVAILPMLGVGGMQLYRAETPGPIKDAKLTPRITETAKLLWYVYLALTLLCILAYRVAGMNWYDAVCHAFSALSTGGFSTHDSSIGFFDNPAIDYITVVFMFLAGMNFSLHFLAWRSLHPGLYWRDSEFRTYLLVILLMTCVATAMLWKFNTASNVEEAFRFALFHVTSVMTSTGLLITDHSIWPNFLPVLLVFASFVGGCAGSTGGGLKVIRFLLLMKQGFREMNLLSHPSAQLHVKINREPVPEKVVKAVWGFFAMYIAVFSVFMLGIMAAGENQVTAFAAVAATLNNMGVGLGDVASNFAGLNDFSKWWLSLAMLMGRLELFTVLVLFTPAFWRR